MNLSDPISDMLTRIRNANMAGHDTVQIPHSKMKSEIARILKEEGYIKEFTTENIDGKATLVLFLKYIEDQKPVIQGLRRVSRPSCRHYVGAGDVPRVLGGIGTAILSTSSGILCDTDARRKHIGGEVLCYIW
ncbi:30S ribosomal protein S8 [Tichowtungia aerotolerans]|uniref:Small ribosomal subunit protein uS8 n=1 Tax=Tichowtungia aerotolerans TaxID=2697043 RepID=A0A6P1M2A0_9BACT|nr:30S ribosomal protein S8 [Tichowtungia aerotolerans]QHI68242.1 30S ribosomal protein S8 [Tichowtungia aerotolerans]